MHDACLSPLPIMGFMATTIIILAFLVFLLAYVGNSQKNDSNFIFHGFKGANLSMDGSPIITSNGLLQLTNQTGNSVGRAFYPSPIDMLIQRISSNTSSTVSSFSTSFVFGIIPSDGEKRGGHGFAFAISPTTQLSGNLAGNFLGLFNGTNNGNSMNHVFAVEFDTVGAGAEFGDLDSNHVGIDVNSVNSLFQKTAPMKMEEGKPIQVWIEYDGVGKYINVTLSDQLDEPMPSTPFLSTPLDLSNIFKGDPIYVGFSASTGSLGLISSHYILGWSFRLNGTAERIRSSNLPSFPPVPDTDMNLGWDDIIIGVSSGAGGLLLSLFLLYKKIFNSLCHWIFSRFANETKDSKNVEVLLESLGCLALQRYKYSDIMAMTKSFKHKLGLGGYGCVFKGTLRNDGRLVAIKVLNESKGNGEEFINEVATIGKTNHVNVVTLLGFCIEGNKRALVYEFMSNGSLERFIYNEKTSSTQSTHLGWEKLYQIALGIAKGLDYLHCGCNTRILHFDIKPHNILLDKDFFPKISDFGLAKLCLTRETIVSMVGARGTLGYIAPEISCRNLGGVSHKSDVYSYGMMVLEMIGGRKNLDVTVENMSEMYFPHWIYNQLKQDSKVEEPKVIKFEGPEEILKDAKAKKMIIVALWCIQTHPASRPSMTKVVEMLEGSTEELQIPPNPSMNLHHNG